MVAHHHHVAALDGALRDVLDVLLRVEGAQRLDDVGLLPVAGGRAGVGDDGALGRDDGHVLHKAAVRILLHGGEDRDLGAAGLHGADVLVVLPQGQVVVRQAEVCGGDALDHGPGGTADDDVAKHGIALLILCIFSRSAARSRACFHYTIPGRKFQRARHISPLKFPHVPPRSPCAAAPNGVS